MIGFTLEDIERGFELQNEFRQRCPRKDIVFQREIFYILRLSPVTKLGRHGIRMAELRKDPIVNRWVIISEERGVRPSDFHMHAQATPSEFCPFCEGSERFTPAEIFSVRPTSSRPDQPGWTLRVVPNKFPALSSHERESDRNGDFLSREPGYGHHEVIIETPLHARRPSDLSVAEWATILTAFKQRLLDMRNDPRVKYALIFKNHGALAGATVDHMHSQLIATPIVPLAVDEELRAATEYHRRTRECVYCHLIQEELSHGHRLVCHNGSFVSLQAFASRFPCETWILGRKHSSRYEDESEGALTELAGLIRETIIRLDKAAGMPPFNMVLHTAPTGDDSHTGSYHWHFEILPKLTQTAGFEWGSGFFINPMAPEKAAESMRSICLS